MVEIKKRRQSSHEKLHQRTLRGRSTSSPHNDLRRRTPRRRRHSRVESELCQKSLIFAGDRKSEPIERPQPRLPLDKVFNFLRCSAEVDLDERLTPMSKNNFNDNSNTNDSLLVMTSEAALNPATNKTPRKSPIAKQNDQQMKEQMDKNYFHTIDSSQGTDVGRDRKTRGRSRTTDFKSEDQMARRRSSTPMPKNDEKDHGGKQKGDVGSKTKRRHASDSKVKSEKNKPKIQKDGTLKSSSKHQESNKLFHQNSIGKLKQQNLLKRDVDATSRVDTEITSFISTALQGDVEMTMPSIKVSSRNQKEALGKSKSENKTPKRQRSNHTSTEKKSTKSNHSKPKSIEALKSDKQIQPQRDTDLSKPGLETTLKFDEDISSFVTSALQENLKFELSSITFTSSELQEGIDKKIKPKKQHKSQCNSTEKKTNCLKEIGIQHPTEKKRQIYKQPKVKKSTENLENKANSIKQICKKQPKDEMDYSEIAAIAKRFPVKKEIQLYVASEIEMPRHQTRPKPRHKPQDEQGKITNAKLRMQDHEDQECTSEYQNVQNEAWPRNHNLNADTAVCNSEIIKSNGGITVASNSNFVLQIPPFYAKDHNITRRMMEFLKFPLKDDIIPRIDVQPYLYHSAYYEVPDRLGPGRPAFNSKVTLYLNVQGICAYFGYTNMLENLVKCHDIGNCKIKANEPCFAAGIHETSKFSDVESISPACLALRRGHGSILTEFMRRGWSIYDTVRVFYRRPFGENDFIYDDGIDYLLEVMYEKPGFNLMSIFKPLIYGKHTNFQVHYYKIIKRNLGNNETVAESVSIPRRLLQHLTHEHSMNNTLSVLFVIMMFADQNFFDGHKDCNETIEVSRARLSNLVHGLMEGNHKSSQTFDQDCCIALCLGMVQHIHELGHKAKTCVRQFLLQLTVRILSQTLWLIPFTITPAEGLAQYFKELGEPVIIGTEAVEQLQWSIPDLLRQHRHSLMKDINSVKVAECAQHIDPQFAAAYYRGQTTSSDPK